METIQRSCPYCAYIWSQPPPHWMTWVNFTAWLRCIHYFSVSWIKKNWRREHRFVHGIMWKKMTWLASTEMATFFLSSYAQNLHVVFYFEVQFTVLSCSQEATMVPSSQEYKMNYVLYYLAGQSSWTTTGPPIDWFPRASSVVIFVIAGPLTVRVAWAFALLQTCRLRGCFLYKTELGTRKEISILNIQCVTYPLVIFPALDIRNFFSLTRSKPRLARTFLFSSMFWRRLRSYSLRAAIPIDGHRRLSLTNNREQTNGTAPEKVMADRFWFARKRYASRGRICVKTKIWIRPRELGQLDTWSLSFTWLGRPNGGKSRSHVL